MNKRQRKKHRTGEFTEYGFQIEVELIAPEPALSTADMVIAFLEANHLCCGGGCNDTEIDLFVTGLQPHPDDRGWIHNRSCTEEDRIEVATFILGCGNVDRSTVGPLVDAWRE